MGKSNQFYSKVLLFGEYSIISGSKGVTIPYSSFSGELQFQKAVSNNIYKDNELYAFYQYLAKLDDNKDLIFDFDLTSFKFDISQGIYFNSTIPQGYGVGSSGALCSALFQKYGKLKVNTEEKKNYILVLKKIFAQMESHFHGESSGIDPLISYLNGPILMNGTNDLEMISLPKYESGNGAIFILDTGRARRTEPLVNLYLEKLSTKDFSDKCNKEFIPITNRCVEHFLDGNMKDLMASFGNLSRFQFENLRAMVPNLFVDIWKYGMESGDYFLKFCGAGGGGFLLGITKDFKNTEIILNEYALMPIIRF